MMRTSEFFNKNAVTHILIFSLTLFCLSACGGDESEPGIVNAVSTNVASSGITGGKGGAVIIISEGDETSLDGDAMFMMQSNAGSEVLQLSIYSYQSDSDFMAINITNMNGEATPGTYSINKESDFKVTITRNVAGVQSVGGPNSGQVGIYTANSSRITGSFLLYVEMVTGTDSGSTTNYAVHGTFEAFKGEHSGLPVGLQ